MHFTGRVELRSSDPFRVGVKKAPGETEIQKLNPEREVMIRNVTGWKTLAAGSLNLIVDNTVVAALAALETAMEESGTAIRYPPGSERIPLMREAYWYYTGIARVGAASEAVLVRRAKVPRPGVVELFAAVSLTEKFNLVPNAVVEVEVQAHPRTK